GPRTAFGEHLVEATETVADRAGVCRLHVTVAPSYEERFRDVLNRIKAERAKDRLAPRLGSAGIRFAGDFSRQHPATDTLAIDRDGRPFRGDDGTLLLRPGGHGALIENLEGMAAEGADLVLLKNIDNVLPDRGRPPVVLWRRLLLGHLVDLQTGIAHLLER